MGGKGKRNPCHNEKEKHPQGKRAGCPGQEVRVDLLYASKELSAIRTQRFLNVKTF